MRKIPETELLLANDAAVHDLSEPAIFKMGNRDRILADPEYNKVAALTIRGWTVEGNVAWALYDGTVKSDPLNTAFWVVERFTVEDGYIHEILASVTIRDAAKH